MFLEHKLTWPFKYYYLLIYIYLFSCAAETPISEDSKNLVGHTIKCAGKKDQPLTSCKPPITLKPSPKADRPCLPFPGKPGYPICNRPPANRPKP